MLWDTLFERVSCDGLESCDNPLDVVLLDAVKQGYSNIHSKVCEDFVHVIF